jgi:signal transduction histidine kinase
MLDQNASSQQYQQLIQDLNRKIEDLALLNQLSVALSATSDIDRIMDTTLTQLMSYLSIDFGEIYLRQEDSPILRLVHHHGKQLKSIWNHDHYTLRHSALGEITRGASPKIFLLPHEMVKELNPKLAELGCHQVVCIPIPGSKEVLGVLCLASCRDKALDERELKFLSSSTARVGSAIEYVRQVIQGRRLAILEERERIGMDLHDGIIQSIYAVGLTLEHARLLLNEDTGKSKERIEQAIADLNHAIRDIRTYILDLRPRRLMDENLMEGVKRLVQEFRSNTLLEVNLQGPEEGALEELSSTNALALFLICQEALANIAKHARARHISVVVWTARDRVLLEVHDDGKGFDIDKAHATLGHGLSNMEIRARTGGGEVDVTSEPGLGTTVLAWVPLRKKG